MFNKRTFSIVLAVGLLITALSGIALAQNPGAGARMQRIAKLKDYLALTDKQSADIQELFKKHQAAVLPIRQDLRARSQELRNAMDTAEPNAATVGQLVIGRHSLRSQLRTLNQKLHDDIAAKLTPEQQQKFSQMKSRIGRRARHG